MNHGMQIAYDEAINGMHNNDGGPFGAAIIHNGEVVASAHNEVLRTNDPTAHAEINAIRKASQILGRFDLSDCILYTTCYPCPMCMGAILWARIPAVYYGASKADAARGGFDDNQFYTLLQHPDTALDLHPVDTEKTKKLFDLWLAKKDRILY
ncbi:MAG: nucleoside deaminase [Sulfuricurvum sp.]|uniref:nucleoside deaminase n=1 Tax=Sulfuricurvum sp. TaxID=2025608 RepID=UPI00261BA467|nr:nucleoside deaminase [Sulfuricurvum sp.]MDD5159872.1 nucleoside deaminase [Sulfuricurvum sp.]